jgi:hypothetical protein
MAIMFNSRVLMEKRGLSAAVPGWPPFSTTGGHRNGGPTAENLLQKTGPLMMTGHHVSTRS